MSVGRRDPDLAAGWVPTRGLEWAAPEPQGRDVMLQTYGERYDVLIGRRAYNVSSTFWSHVPAGDPFADRLRAATEHVVTHRPQSLEWGRIETVGPNLGDGARSVKESDGPDLVCCGSSTLTSALVQHGLADEPVLPFNPVLVGTGKRLFTEATPGRTFELASTTALPAGIVVCAYRLGEPSQRTAVMA